MRRLIRVLRLPLDDYRAALEVCLGRPRLHAVVLTAAAFVLSWWVYVPVHELCHALGCVVTGGEVTRLEIDPLYGAALLQRVFPFVAVGSEYAGQLTGFDTHGNDLTYLATDFCPFLLTLLVGVPLLRSIATRPMHPVLTCVAFGAALPVAFAPFISIPGDYYEMGSILVSRLVVFWLPSFPLTRWRSDDLFKLADQLVHTPGASFGDVAGVSASLLLGIVLVFATYWVGTLVGRVIRR